MPIAPEDRYALRDLVEAYATAADTRDDDLFVSLFAVGGSLRVHQEGALLGSFDAPDGLREATAPLDRYRATMHLVANHACRPTGEGAEGTTYCLAHHLRPAADGGVEDLQMVLRYDDRYVRDTSGAWRFATRDLHILWTEVHAASAEPPTLVAPE